MAKFSALSSKVLMWSLWSEQVQNPKSGNPPSGRPNPGYRKGRKGIPEVFKDRVGWQGFMNDAVVLTGVSDLKNENVAVIGSGIDNPVE